MTMINNNTKYTDLTQSKRLKEIGFETEADGYYTTDENGAQLYCSLTQPNFMDIETFAISSVTGNVTIKELSHWIKSYRLDTLLLALPDGIYQDQAMVDADYLWDALFTEDKDYSYSKANNIYQRVSSLMYSRGSQAIAAAVDLIVLLKEILK